MYLGHLYLVLNVLSSSANKSFNFEQLFMIFKQPQNTELSFIEEDKLKNNTIKINYNQIMSYKIILSQVIILW